MANKVFESVFSNFSNLFAKNSGDLYGGKDRVDRGVPIRDYVNSDIQVASALTAIYTKAVQTRR